MIDLIIPLGFLALGAWLTYICGKKSGLWLVVPVGYGAVLGLVALIAATLIADINPAGPLGAMFSVLLSLLVLSAAGWLVVALFSPAARASMAAHETVYALWFGAAIGIGAFACLYRFDWPMLTIRGLRQPRCLGRNMAEWLPVLRTDTNRTEPPLRIVRVIYNDEPEYDAVEVPLSWDLMCKNGLFDRRPSEPGEREAASVRAARLTLLMNGRVAERIGREAFCWRATNGNCLLRFHHRHLRPGTNEIQVTFTLFAPGPSRLSATGPPTRIEFNARGL